jgi:hypothetical protein
VRPSDAHSLTHGRRIGAGHSILTVYLHLAEFQGALGRTQRLPLHLCLATFSSEILVKKGSANPPVGPFLPAMVDSMFRR